MPPPSALALQTACRALLDGEVIACPTEAVWGLSCDPENEEAVECLLALKARPASKGLILVATFARVADGVDATFVGHQLLFPIYTAMD